MISNLTYELQEKKRPRVFRAQSHQCHLGKATPCVLTDRPRLQAGDGAQGPAQLGGGKALRWPATQGPDQRRQGLGVSTVRTLQAGRQGSLQHFRVEQLTRELPLSLLMRW